MFTFFFVQLKNRNRKEREKHVKYFKRMLITLCAEKEEFYISMESVVASGMDLNEQCTLNLHAKNAQKCMQILLAIFHSKLMQISYQCRSCSHDLHVRDQI